MENQNLQISSAGQFTRILFTTPVNVDLNKISDDVVRDILKDKIPEYIPEEMELRHGYFCSCVGVQYRQNLGQTPNGENIVNGTTFYLTDVNGNSYVEETLFAHMGTQEEDERPLEIGGILMRARISIDDYALEPYQWGGPDYSKSFDIVGEALRQGIPVSEARKVDRDRLGLSYDGFFSELGYRAMLFDPTQERVAETVPQFLEVSRYFKEHASQIVDAAHHVSNDLKLNPAEAFVRNIIPGGSDLFARADAALVRLTPPLENLEPYLIKPIDLN